MTVAITVGILMAGCAYLVLQRGMIRVVLGLVLLSHAAHLVLMATGGTSRREAPLFSDPDPAVTADALPQAFVLTAIVIAFAITMYLLVLTILGTTDDESEVGDTDGIDVIPDLTDVEHAQATEADLDHLWAYEDPGARDRHDGGDHS